MKKPRMSDDETDDCSLWRNLPPDIIAHVISRLPLKCLCRFQCVSKSWKYLISSSKTHINPTNTNNPPKAILISSSQALYSIDFADVNPTAKKLDFPLFQHSAKGVKFLCCCDGLLLVSQEGNFKTNFLWNPLTRECKKLPESPLISGIVSGIGYDSSTDDYKVVMVNFHLNEAAVYSLKTDAWRRFPDGHFDVWGSGVYLNGHLHWINSCLNAPCLVAFNLSDEIFRKMQLPDKFNIYQIGYYWQVRVVGGCLCFLRCGRGGPMEVWMMKEYGVLESLTRLTVIDDPTKNSCARLLLGLLSEDDFLLFLSGRRGNHNKLVVYNKIKETYRDMVIPGIPTQFEFLVNCVETLVSPNHIGRIGRHCEASSGKPP